MLLQTKILACVDHSKYADFVTDYAVWAAERLQTPIEIMHLFDRHPERGSGSDHSGSIGFDAQDVLLHRLTDEDSDKARAAKERGRLLLNGLRERAMTKTRLSIDVRHREGGLIESLSEMSGDTQLLVVGRRGESAGTTNRDLGRNLEQILRTMKCPILTVTADFNAPSKVLVAYDGTGATRRVVEWIASNPLLLGIPMHVVMAGKSNREAPGQLDWAASALSGAGFEVTTEFRQGDTERVLALVSREQNAGLLVMGAYSHSPWQSLFLGSRTNELLRSAIIPTLVVR